ncbi:hypothetical protein, partial [Desulfitobacterium sp.]|uniref:hypothetical protein n=1 Tax=Desulfitobacterium sp. TaxID=49981 RepID=UPI002BA1C4BE
MKLGKGRKIKRELMNPKVNQLSLAMFRLISLKIQMLIAHSRFIAPRARCRTFFTSPLIRGGGSS